MTPEAVFVGIYTILEPTPKRTHDVTSWQQWFLTCLRRATDGSQDALARVLDKARFWDRFAHASLSARQVTVLTWLPDGFEGKLTTSNWAKLAKCSQGTAYRGVLELVERGTLRKDSGGGRSLSYS